MGTHYEGSKKERRALDTFIRLQRASSTLMGQLAASLAEEDLTVSQFGVLEVLLHLGPLCQKTIAEKQLQSPGNITTVVDNLEKRGLVERVRSAEDRRFVVVHLTDAGRAFIEELFPRHAARIAAALGGLSAKDQEALGALCKQLGTSLQAAARASG